MFQPSTAVYKKRCGVNVCHTLHIPSTILSVLLAFPLGIVIALAEAVSLFSTILPISILFGLVCPIIVPLITISGTLVAVWFLAQYAFSTVALAAETAADAVNTNGRIYHVFRLLLHAHELAYMGIYGAWVVFIAQAPFDGAKPQVKVKPAACHLRHRLHINQFPKSSVPVYPLTPPCSDPSYTPTRSPINVDFTFPLHAHSDEPSFTSLSRLSGLLCTLDEQEIELVMTYVDTLKQAKIATFVG